MIIVFGLWGWSIGLFIHRWFKLLILINTIWLFRWGKIRSIPYIPSFETVQRELEEKIRKERYILADLIFFKFNNYLKSKWKCCSVTNIRFYKYYKWFQTFDRLSELVSDIQATLLSSTSRRQSSYPDISRRQSFYPERKSSISIKSFRGSEMKNKHYFTALQNRRR